RGGGVAGFARRMVPPAPAPASGPTALYLRAVLAPNSEPLGVPLYWTVAAEDQPKAALFEAWAASPVVPITPGRYVVEAGNGLVSARQTGVVRENPPLGLTPKLPARTP